MRTMNMIKRAIVSGLVLLSLGFALTSQAQASVAPSNNGPVQPLCGDGNESHGKG
jgi:hypothetical protein